jgi:hypothetical protein
MGHEPPRRSLSAVTGLHPIPAAPSRAWAAVKGQFRPKRSAAMVEPNSHLDRWRRVGIDRRRRCAACWVASVYSGRALPRQAAPRHHFEKRRMPTFRPCPFMISNAQCSMPGLYQMWRSSISRATILACFCAALSSASSSPSGSGIAFRPRTMMLKKYLAFKENSWGTEVFTTELSNQRG